MDRAATSNESRVLVIEDDPMVRSEIESILEEESIKVASFESGNHAIRHMQSRSWSWTPQLVITDLVMDGLGGYELMRRIAELYPNTNIPIIVVSRLYSADYVYEAEVAGASLFLQKPLVPQKLVQAVKRLMRSY